MIKSADQVLAKVRDDEPIFVIRGQDKLAPEIVQAWIEAAVMEGVRTDKIVSAHRYLHDIVVYQKDHPDLVKVPD